ncbi:hypothetical protein JOC77_000312 [Peribacillus deserti]|uniref:Uncharacterized protein n=1 Tax=Peribacillus deserti TaxID=673318 RepID=A0ABS2QCP5_9BACI|nr:hypothetical protein [Peribacillus deserti]
MEFYRGKHNFSRGILDFMRVSVFYGDYHSIVGPVCISRYFSILEAYPNTHLKKAVH